MPRPTRSKTSSQRRPTVPPRAAPVPPAPPAKVSPLKRPIKAFPRRFAGAEESFSIDDDVEENPFRDDVLQGGSWPSGQATRRERIAKGMKSKADSGVKKSGSGKGSRGEGGEGEQQSDRRPLKRVFAPDTPAADAPVDEQTPSNHDNNDDEVMEPSDLSIATQASQHSITAQSQSQPHTFPSSDGTSSQSIYLAMPQSQSQTQSESQTQDAAEAEAQRARALVRDDANWKRVQPMVYRSQQWWKNRVSSQEECTSYRCRTAPPDRAQVQRYVEKLIVQEQRSHVL